MILTTICFISALFASFYIGRISVSKVKHSSANASISILETHYKPIVIRNVIKLNLYEDFIGMHGDYNPLKLRKEEAIHQLKQSILNSIDVEITEEVNSMNPFELEIKGEVIIYKK